MSGVLVLERCAEEFEATWTSEEGRLSIVDAKLVIRSLNRELQGSGKRTLNVHALAKAMPGDALAPEVVDVIDQFEAIIVRN